MITPAVIKEVFKVFNEDISEGDAESKEIDKGFVLSDFLLDLLRFLGCNDEMMTFHDLKHFFNKNL